MSRQVQQNEGQGETFRLSDPSQIKRLLSLGTGQEGEPRIMGKPPPYPLVLQVLILADDKSLGRLGGPRGDKLPNDLMQLIMEIVSTNIVINTNSDINIDVKRKAYQKSYHKPSSDDANWECVWYFRPVGYSASLLEPRISAIKDEDGDRPILMEPRKLVEMALVVEFNGIDLEPS
eukprot:Clim_evm14s78 gene=Clim_evmTU14s78